MKFFQIFKFASFFLTGLIIIGGCKKSNNKKSTSYSISYTGTQWIGDTINFQSTAPNTSTFLWEFGDGTSSTSANPFHIYNSPSIDTVILIINNDSTNPIIKTIQITPGASRMAGTWHWTGGYISFYGSDTSTPHTITDTTFPINFVNDSMIETWGYAFPYFLSLSEYYGHFDPDIIISVSSINDTLYFSYKSGGLGGGSTITYHTP